MPEAGLKPVPCGLQYQVSLAAEGYDKYESERFESRPGQVHDVGRLILVSTAGFVEGIVTDSAGRPIAGARVFNCGDAPKVLSTQTGPAGRFRLEGLRGAGLRIRREAGLSFRGGSCQGEKRV